MWCMGSQPKTHLEQHLKYSLMRVLLESMQSARKRTWRTFSMNITLYMLAKMLLKPDSLSKTFKVSLSPHQYRRLFNPSLWDSGICVKRFLIKKDIICIV